MLDHQDLLELTVAKDWPDLTDRREFKDPEDPRYVNHQR